MTVQDLEYINGERPKYEAVIVNDLGPALVIEDEKGPLCFVVAVIIWPGVAEMSLQMVRKEHLVGLLKRLRWLMKRTVEHCGLWRLQATVTSDWPGGDKWMKFFGLKKEGVLKQYCQDKSDGVMYGRTF